MTHCTPVGYAVVTCRPGPIKLIRRRAHIQVLNQGEAEKLAEELRMAAAALGRDEENFVVALHRVAEDAQNKGQG